MRGGEEVLLAWVGSNGIAEDDVGRSGRGGIYDIDETVCG